MTQEPTNPHPPEPGCGPSGNSRSDYAEFVHRVLLVVGILTAVFITLLLLWLVVDILLLIFAGVLLAIFIRGVSEWVSRTIRVPLGWSIFLVVVVLVGIVGLAVWRLGPHVASQVEQLIRGGPHMLHQLKGYLEQYPLGRSLVHETRSFPQFSKNIKDMLQGAKLFFFTTFGIIGSGIVVVFIGLYLTAEPDLYLSGIERLVPISKRKRCRQVLHTLGYTLHWWLIGRFLELLLVGVMSGLGLWLLGIPLALTFGLLSGFSTFIPYIGPFLSSLLPILLALSLGPIHCFYTVVLYIVIYTIDSYLILPVVQEQTVALPPVVTLVSQVVMGLLVGFIGIIFATPLAAIILVLVKMLYVEDVLHDTIDVLGECVEEESG